MSKIKEDSRDLNKYFKSNIKPFGAVAGYIITDTVSKEDIKGVLINDKPLGAICGFTEIGPMGRFEYDDEKENN